MYARDLMTSPPITCHVNDSLALAARKLWDYDIGAIAVVNDEGKLTGVITDRDICMAAYTQGRALEDILINSAMAVHVVSAPPDATISEIQQLMANHRIRRIPIINAARIPIGVVSMNDLAIEIARSDSRIAHGSGKLAHTLAAVCRHRAVDEAA